MKMLKKYNTAQRAAILEYLKDGKSHPSAMDIYEEVSRKLSTISMTTVYNTMDLLKKEGLIHELPLRNLEGRRYDSNPTPHDHLICNICSRVIDISVEVGHSLSLNEKQQHDFDINEICINVYGVCPDCKSREDETVFN